MAPYNQEWDEEVPIGSVTPANTIDDIFVALKEALGEWLAEVIIGFRNDGQRPKVVRIPVGLEVERPESPLGDGHLYVASDTHKLFVSHGS